MFHIYLNKNFVNSVLRPTRPSVSFTEICRKKQSKRNMSSEVTYSTKSYRNDWISQFGLYRYDIIRINVVLIKKRICFDVFLLISVDMRVLHHQKVSNMNDAAGLSCESFFCWVLCCFSLFWYVFGQTFINILYSRPM